MAEKQELTPEQIRDGHIERFKQGVEVWNAWAEETLREKEKLEKAGKWNVREDFDKQGHYRELSSTPETQNWLDRAFVNFSALHFASESEVQGGEIEPAPPHDVKSISVTTEVIDFSYFKFPGDAWFNSATFTGDAQFDNATFTGDAWFDSVTFTGVALFDSATFTGDARFNSATFTGNALFDSATFTGDAQFDNATFTGNARFNSATFTGDAWFNNATFTGNVQFDNATFTGDAWFDSATFTGVALFDSATFTGDAWFNNATFTGNANFCQADFESLATFSNSSFLAKAEFEAIKAERGFTLADATFTSQVPNFIQANFEEAPRLDDVEVPKFRLFRPGDREIEAKFRALKRLAIQAHDHDKELEFFAGEIRARRHASDKLLNFPAGTIRYLAGALYGLISDFGRSIWRPFILFAVVFYAFAQLYIHQATALTDGKCANSDKMTASYAAYTIAAKNSLLFLGTDRTDKIKRAYTCLYGAAPIYEMPNTTGNNRIKTGYKNITPTSRHMAPHVPWAVSALGTAHSIFSLILIFLLLLAIRNQFKIK